jgi:hypothetical protein
LTKRTGLGTVEANNYNWAYYQDKSSPGQAYLNLGTCNGLIWQNGGPGGLWYVVGGSSKVNYGDYVSCPNCSLWGDIGFVIQWKVSVVISPFYFSFQE